jgi:hypothetical protein
MHMTGTLNVARGGAGDVTAQRSTAHSARQVSVSVSRCRGRARRLVGE